MRKVLLIVLTVFLAGTFTNTVKAQAVEQGTMIIDAYYGWPNLWSSVLKSAVTDANSQGVKVTSLGPLGGRFEYMASDKMGVGVDINYSNTSVKWSEDSLGSGTGTMYDYKVSVPRLRALFRFNLHFGGGDEFDAYWTIGAGYGHWGLKYETNDPYYNDDQITFNTVPVSFRTGIGCRYFFTDNIGANVELGLGGPLMTFGLSAKF